MVTSAPPGPKNPCAAARCVFGLAFANSTPWMVRVVGSGGCHGRPGYLVVWGYFELIVAPALAANTRQCGSYPRGPRFFGVPGAPKVQRADMMIIQAKKDTASTRYP